MNEAVFKIKINNDEIVKKYVGTYICLKKIIGKNFEWKHTIQILIFSKIKNTYNMLKFHLGKTSSMEKLIGFYFDRIQI